MRTRARFESQHLLADGAQCLLFFAQDIPGFFAGDLTLAKPLDHGPYLSAVFVGPFLKSVRRAQDNRIGLHRCYFLVIINGQAASGLSDLSSLSAFFSKEEIRNSNENRERD